MVDDDDPNKTKNAVQSRTKKNADATLVLGSLDEWIINALYQPASRTRRLMLQTRAMLDLSDMASAIQASAFVTVSMTP